MGTTNLLKETLTVLGARGKTPADVRWVGATKRDTFVAGSWDDFAALADFDYDNGYGGAEVEYSLKIVGDDWWLERGEYDGSEWWEFKTLPERDPRASPLRASDLRDS